MFLSVLQGTAVSFITQNHARLARELVKILQDSGNEVPRVNSFACPQVCDVTRGYKLTTDVQQLS